MGVSQEVHLQLSTAGGAQNHGPEPLGQKNFKKMFFLGSQNHGPVPIGQNLL